MIPQIPSLWEVSVAFVLALGLGALYGTFARWLLRKRAQLSMTSSIVMAILGSAAGFALTSMISPSATVRSPLAISLALGGSVLAVAIYCAIAAHFQKPQRETTAELLRTGESDRVEFKSTARINLHTGAKDAKMELVVAKTIAAFLNTDGGTLIIGVDDDGQPLGLDADLQVMKVPDHDRYELWLRDWLTTTLGLNAASQVKVEFESLPDSEDNNQAVCRISIPASPQAIYLRPSKNTDPQLWVRTGNSTRQLPVDDAAVYIAHRWPISVASNLAAQFRSSMRFSQAK